MEIVSWIIHTIVIQLSILLFALPFWVWYYISLGKKQPQYKQQSLNKQIEDFFSSRQMDLLIFTWAATEAVIWFVIPEFLLLLVIFMRIRQRWGMLMWDFLGTITGTAIAFFISASPAIVANMPYITPMMVIQMQAWYEHFGITSLIFQPFSGVPYKVFTHLAILNSINLWELVLVGTLVRIGRYVMIYTILEGLYPLFHRFVYKRYVAIFFLACAIFSFLLLRVVMIYGPSYKVIVSPALF